MTMLKKIALILAITAGTLAGVSCSNISMSDDGGGYTVTITNGTGGYLSSLQVGETVCSDVAPDATCVATYNYRPVDLEITYTGKQVLGYPAAADVYTNKIERTPEVGTTSYEETLVLEDSWVSVWVENTSESYAVDMLSIGNAITNNVTDESLFFSGNTVSTYLDNSNIIDPAGIAFEVDGSPINASVNVAGEITGSDIRDTGFLNFKTGGIFFQLNNPSPPSVTINYSYRPGGEYTGVTNEEIGFANVDTEVSGNLANVGVSNVKIYATVAGEKLSHSVPAKEGNPEEDLTVSAGKATLLNNSSNGAWILKNSVTLKGDSEILATDDGAGKLVPVDERLDPEGTHTIDYSKGKISIELATGVTISDYTITYQYIKALNHNLLRVPKADTLIIKEGDTVIATDKISEDTTNIGLLEGDSVRTNVSSINYTTGELDLMLYTERYDVNVLSGPVTVEYAYKIGEGTGSGENVSLTGNGISTGTVNTLTGAINFSFNTTSVSAPADQNGDGIFAEHTITALHCDYHFPYAVHVEDNFPNLSAAIDAAEVLTFDADTRIVNTMLAHKHVDQSNAVTIKAKYTEPDGTGEEEFTISAVAPSGGATGVLNDGTSDVGTINYATGRVTFTVPDPADSSYVLSSVTVEAYNYFTANSSNKTWAGFFKKSTFESKSFFVMNMTDANTIAHYCEFTDDDFYYEANDSGSLILNLICGKNDYWSAP